MNNSDQLDIIDKLVKISISAKKDIRSQIVKVICFAPDEETIKDLETALKLVERAMQKTASYHCARKRKLRI